nr:hypothetical protein CFP56_07836 [Quercus suber]
MFDECSMRAGKTARATRACAFPMRITPSTRLCTSFALFSFPVLLLSISCRSCIALANSRCASETAAAQSCNACNSSRLMYLQPLTVEMLHENRGHEVCVNKVIEHEPRSAESLFMLPRAKNDRQALFSQKYLNLGKDDRPPYMRSTASLWTVAGQLPTPSRCHARVSPVVVLRTPVRFILVFDRIIARVGGPTVELCSQHTYCCIGGATNGAIVAGVFRLPPVVLRASGGCASQENSDDTWESPMPPAPACTMSSSKNCSSTSVQLPSAVSRADWQSTPASSGVGLENEICEGHCCVEDKRSNRAATCPVVCVSSAREVSGSIRLGRHIYIGTPNAAQHGSKSGVILYRECSDQARVGMSAEALVMHVLSSAQRALKPLDRHSSSKVATSTLSRGRRFEGQVPSILCTHYPCSLPEDSETMANQSSSCSAVSSTPVVLNDAATRVCAVNSLNAPLLESCCEGSGVLSSQCKHYCNTNKTIIEFIACLTHEGRNSSSVLAMNPFCQDSIVSNNTETLAKTSYGTRRASPLPLQYLFVALLLVLLSATNVSATMVRSLSTDMQRRQSTALTSCSIDIHGNYTSIRNSQQVSSHYTCDSSDYCTQSIPIDTGIVNNNRTINGTSASEPMYDVFFEMLENSTGRMFPALSGIELQYGYVTAPGIEYFIDFTPYAWCMNATVSTCADLIGGSNNTLPVEVCGPLFISDNHETSRVTAGDDIIQGVFSTVTVG